ncbi:MAG: hypothetical protein ABW360_11310 [Phenylobacterium sp.]
MSVALAAAPGLAHAQPVDLFVERTVMAAADLRCGLFAPEVAAALSAATAQARGAALRGGVRPATLAGLAAKAEVRAAKIDCSSRDMALAAQRVRDAFSGYARMTRISYPGDQAGWQADRASGRSARWRLKQETRFGPDSLSFGLVGREGPGTLLAVAQFADGATPYSARILMRDTERSSGPYLERWNGGPTATLPLPRRLPPRAHLESFTTQARSPAGVDLLPKDAKGGWAFRFSDDAARQLAALDPREAVLVEFLFMNGRQPVRQAYVEVGDFAAGRAFLQLAER